MRKILLISFAIFICISTQAQETDLFAQIGGRAQAERIHLLEDRPAPLLPARFLPLEQGNAHAFQPLEKISTREELYKELEKMRAHYKPFMANHAPELPEKRKSIKLEKFSWRVETEADKSSFQDVLLGKGSWEEVKIPHYGPPMGRARTYYRKTFQLTLDMIEDKSIFACFKGVDYKANVFINGRYVGSHEGFFAPFEFNMSDFIQEGENTLLIQVENDYPAMGFMDDKGNKVYGDKIYAASGPGWDESTTGWHHSPPGMGIYQECFIEVREPLHINDVFVMPLPGEKKAEVWLEVNNYYSDYQDVTFSLSLFGQNFKEESIHNLRIVPETVHVPGYGDMAKNTDWNHVRLQMGYGVNFYKTTIDIPDMRLWEQDEPWLYQLQVSLLDKEEQVTDVRKQTFGMRSFTMDTVNIPKGSMHLNGKMVRLRGANDMGNMQQDVMNQEWDQLMDDILLAKLANINFLRFTQRPEQTEIYDYCDMLGMMVQTDLPLFGGMRLNKWSEVVKQAGEMERLVRNHPSNILVTYINERFANAEGYPQRNMSTPEQYERLFTACDQAILMANPLRVIKAGDGDYDPPSPGLPDNHVYNTWYNGHGLALGKMHKGYWMPVKPDWYYACGEFGSEGLDPVQTMQKYYPKTWLPTDKKTDKDWNAGLIPLAQTQRFYHMWYNRQHSQEDWVEASQEHQAWGTRLMTEAFRRDNRMISFAIHLFIDAWPSGWMKSIMDVDRNPKKAYFAYRDALEPLLVNLRSDRFQFFSGDTVRTEAWICNDGNDALQGHLIRYQLEDEDGKVLMTGNKPADVPVNSSEFQGYLQFKAPEVNQRSVCTLRLALFDSTGGHLSESVIEVTIFPTQEENPVTNTMVLGRSDGPAEAILEELNLNRGNSIGDSPLLLIDDHQQYMANKAAIDAHIHEGATAIFTNLPQGAYRLGETDISIHPTYMGAYYFVSPSAMLEDTQPLDFKFLYDENTDYATPLTNSYFIPENEQRWTPFLTTGDPNLPDNGQKVYVAGKMAFGKGQFIVSQLQIEGKIRVNPPVYRFLSQAAFTK